MGIYLLFLIYILIIVYKMTFKDAALYFMSKEDTTCMKGILSIAVVLTHCWRGEGENIVLTVFHSFGYIAVAMFFLISGYGLKYQVNKNKNYLKGFLPKRLFNIYIPYLIATSITVIIFDVVGCSSKIDFVRVLKLVFGIDAIWFIQCIVLFYIGFFLIYRYLKKNQYLWITAFVLLEMLLTCLLGMNKQWYGSSLGFLFGIYIADHLDEIKNKKNKFIPLVSFAALSCIFEFFYAKNKQNLIVGNLIIRNLLCVSILFVIILLIKMIRFQNPILKFLGKISYEVFLIHSFIIKFVYVKMSMMSFSLQILLIFVITIAMAFILNYMDQKLLKRFQQKFFK